MPNYVTNRLILFGLAEEVARFKSTCIRQQRNDDLDEASFDFEALVPMPSEILATLDDDTEAAKAQALNATGFDNWYPWALASWGTKWNASFLAILNDECDLLDLTFDTAWSSPEPIFQALAAQYPRLKGYVLGADPMMDWSVFGMLDRGEYVSTYSDAAELSLLIEDCTFNPELSRVSAHALVQDWPNITSSSLAGQATLSPVAAATASMKAALPAEVVVKLEFAAAHRDHSAAFTYFNATELDDTTLPDLAFFTTHDRCRTELDLKLLEELADTVRAEALSISSRDAGLSGLQATAARLAERCGDEGLYSWAALAMYRPGVKLDMGDIGSLRAGFAGYAGRLYNEAVAHLTCRAAGLRQPLLTAAVQGA
ncbi:hypothetical protein ACRBEV_25645 [Methylobacterium phyllosphaerae]